MTIIATAYNGVYPFRPLSILTPDSEKTAKYDRIVFRTPPGMPHSVSIVAAAKGSVVPGTHVLGVFSPVDFDINF